MTVLAPLRPASRATTRLERVILLSDHGRINGGQAEMAIRSALSLKARGLDVVFIAGAGPLDPALEAAGVTCHVVGEYDILGDPHRLRAARTGLWNTRAARMLSQCLEACDPAATVVHVHGWAKALSPSIARVLARRDFATFYTLHEYFIACPNGGFYDYRAQAICTRRPLGLACLTCDCDVRHAGHKAWRVARQAVLKTAGGWPQGLSDVIYLSPRQKDLLGDQFPPGTRWHHLPNPVSEPPGAPIDAAANAPFLFIGRLSREKGGVIAAAAAKAAGVPIVFCGEGEERAAIEAASPDATMLGWVDRDRLRAAMRSARCFVFPSLWYEAFPLVVGEAQAIGLPVLVASTSTAADRVTHGVDGLHVPPGDVAAWTAAMEAMKDDGQVARMGRAALAAANNLLDEDTHTDMLLDIYERSRTRAAPNLPGHGRGTACPAL